MVQHETIKVASFLYQKGIVFASKLHHFSELLNVYYCNIYDSMNSMFSSPDEDVSNEDSIDASAEMESDSDITYFKDNGMNETTMSFTAWDEFNEMTLDLTYIGEDSKGQYVGEAEVYIASDYYSFRSN